MTSGLGFTRVPNSVASYQEMCRKTLALGQTKDDLSHLGRIAILVSPERSQRLDNRADGGFVVGQQVWDIFVHTSSLVCPHSASFERAHINAERSHFLGNRLGESANRPLGRMIRRAAGKSQATAH